MYLKGWGENNPGEGGGREDEKYRWKGGYAIEKKNNVCVGGGKEVENTGGVGMRF